VDVYDVMRSDLFDDESDLYAINPFDWKSAFPFFDKQCFDAIIGNPPYLPIFEMRKDILPYYQQAYETYQKRFDAYGLFLEMAFTRLMGPTSRFGMIIPSSLLNNVAFSKTRELLAQKANVEEIRVLGGAVFKRVNKDTMTLCAQGSGAGSMLIRQYSATTRAFGLETSPAATIPQSAIKAGGISIRAASAEPILSAIASPSVTSTLGEVASTFQGIVTGADDVFISEQFDVEPADRKRIKPFLFGSDIAQYATPNSTGKIAYVTKDANIGNKLLAHLKPARTRLNTRRETRNGRIP
jgi:hypothetical protein